MLIISFDAVGDDEFERLEEYPAFSAFSKKAASFRGVPSIFPSNTYPIHASVATGVMPNVHGVRSNTQSFPARYPVWNNREDGIRVKTLWQAAAAKGIDTAVVFWPVTGFSKTIRYNIPEVLTRPGESQALTSLKAGSKLLQAKMMLKYGKLLDGVNQPRLDEFATACMRDILRDYKPGFALVHLTAFDAFCHKNGKGSDALKTACESLDRSLAILLEAAGDERDVIIFSDHSQINLHTVIEPNSVLTKAGLLYRKGETYIPGESGCYIECCGGAAYLHAGSLSNSQVEEIRASIEQSEWFRRFLTSEEVFNAGYEGVAFGFCAKAGYSFATFAHTHKAEHGYPIDMPDYKVFYMVKGAGLQPGSVTQGGSLLDIAPLVARSLGIDWTV